MSRYDISIALFLVTTIHMVILVPVFWLAPTQQRVTSVPVMQGILLRATSVKKKQQPPNKKVSQNKSEPKKKPEPKPKQKAPVIIKDTPRTFAEAQPDVETPSESEVQSVVMPPRTDASQLNNPTPVYPRLSKRLREQGTTVLELLILEDGSVSEIRIKTSSGHSRLDKAALKAVSKWRYLPAHREGKTISYRYLQPIEFSLQ